MLTVIEKYSSKHKLISKIQGILLETEPKLKLEIDRDWET